MIQCNGWFVLYCDQVDNGNGYYYKGWGKIQTVQWLVSALYCDQVDNGNGYYYSGWGMIQTVQWLVSALYCDQVDSGNDHYNSWGMIQYHTG